MFWGAFVTPLSISALTGRVVRGSRVAYSESINCRFPKDLEGESMLVRDEGMVSTLGEAISAQVVGHGSVESTAWLVGALGDFVKRRDRLVLESNHGTRVEGCIFGEDKPTNFKKDLEGESMLVRDGWMVLTLGEAISAQVVGQGSLESAAWLVGALGGFVKRRDRSGLEIETWYAGRGLHIRGGMINISFETFDLI